MIMWEWFVVTGSTGFHYAFEHSTLFARQTATAKKMSQSGYLIQHVILFQGFKLLDYRL